MYQYIHNNNLKMFNIYLKKDSNHILVWTSFCPKIAHQEDSWWYHYEMPFSRIQKRKHGGSIYLKEQIQEITEIHNTFQVIQGETHFKEKSSTVL